MLYYACYNSLYCYYKFVNFIDTMCPETNNRNQAKDLFEELVKCAHTDDWDTVNDVLVPKIRFVGQEELSKLLLQRVTDPDSRVRDLVATGLTELNMWDSRIVDQAIKAMINMARNDADIFASGRAAVFLLKQLKKPYSKRYASVIEEALRAFYQKVIVNSWEEELIANIPGFELNDFLTP